MSGLLTDGRVMNDLDAVAVGIVEIAGARAVAMRFGLRGHHNAVPFQIHRPAIHIGGLAHDQSEMIERARADTLVGPYVIVQGRTRVSALCGTMQREIVDAG